MSELSNSRTLLHGVASRSCVPPCSKPRKSPSPSSTTSTSRNPASGEVLVRVTYCGVCHSDLSARERHVPADRARRCSGTRRPASSRRSARASPIGRAGRQGRAHAGAVVQQVLLVRARRVRLLRQHAVDAVDRHVARRPHAVVAPRPAGAARRRPRRLRGVRDHDRHRRDQGRSTTHRSKSRASSAARCRPASARC